MLKKQNRFIYLIMAVVFIFAVNIAVIMAMLHYDIKDAHVSINECIERTKMPYDEIQQLVCNSGDEFSFLSEDYELLSELTNLETITFTGIGNAADAKNFFAMLTELDRLTEINIEKSRIGDISALADIKNLKSLSIKECYIVDGFSLSESKSNNDFVNLESFVFNAYDSDNFPDIKFLEKLNYLTFYKYKQSQLPYDKVNWKNIVSLDISYSSVEIIDDRIINELSNLKELNIEHSNISDMEFILSLPSLEKLTWDFDNSQIECLKNHPNFKESWLS